MLPHVIRFNGEQFPDWYRELMEACHGLLPHPAEDGPEGLARYVTELVGLKLDSTPSWPTVVWRALGWANWRWGPLKQWTATFNPRDVDAPCLERLYRKAY